MLEYRKEKDVQKETKEERKKETKTSMLRCDKWFACENKNNKETGIDK